MLARHSHVFTGPDGAGREGGREGEREREEHVNPPDTHKWSILEQAEMDTNSSTDSLISIPCCSCMNLWPIRKGLCHDVQ